MPDDHPWMDLYRQSNIIFCCGQGAWEDEMRVDLQKLHEAFEKYNEYVELLAGRKKLLLKTYLLNLLQRTLHILVTVFCYYAMHGQVSDGLKVFAIQTYVVLGSNFIPVPGAVGISEYIMYHGYIMMLDDESSYTLALLSRGISFYTCCAISIFTVLLGYITLHFRENKGGTISAPEDVL
jgi:uncharacterized protein (TIRG00374 family)